MKQKNNIQQPKVRSEIAQSAWNQTGGGVHEKTGKQRRRDERRKTKVSLRTGRYDD